MDLRIASTSWLLWIRLLYTHKGKSLFKTPPQLFWRIPRSGVAASRGNSFFNLGNCHTVFHCNYALYIATHHAQEFQFLHVPINIYYFLFFKIIAILAGMRSAHFQVVWRGSYRQLLNKPEDTSVHSRQGRVGDRVSGRPLCLWHLYDAKTE